MSYIIDSHCHLNDKKFDFDRKQCIDNFDLNKIKNIIIPGDTLESSRKAAQIAIDNNMIYAAVGIHPHEATTFNRNVLQELEMLAGHKKVVAIGEIGLDYHYDFSPRNIQKDVFIKQLEWAKSINYPVIIHTREATQDTFDILKRYEGQLLGVIHSYTGSIEMAHRFMDMGYYISISGVITFKNAKNVQEMAKNIPLDRLLIETDAPYMAPEPYRGKRNEPKFVWKVAEKIADLKGISCYEVATHTVKNTGELFFKNI